MRTVREASEDEMIAAFLQAEIDSERHAKKILEELRADRRPRSIAESPDLWDAEENAYRPVSRPPASSDLPPWPAWIFILTFCPESMGSRIGAGQRGWGQ